jgi:hypothetical protein
MGKALSLMILSRRDSEKDPQNWAWWHRLEIPALGGGHGGGGWLRQEDHEFEASLDYMRSRIKKKKKKKKKKKFLRVFFSLAT